MIRPVTDADVAPPLTADAIRAMAAQAISDGAIVFIAAWEVPNGTTHMRAFPWANAVVRGMTDTLYEMIYPPPGDE